MTAVVVRDIRAAEKKVEMIRSEPAHSTASCVADLGIADEVLRNLYQRGKYRDVILPMTVLWSLDSVPELTKSEVLAMKKSLDDAQIVNQEQALRGAAGRGDAVPGERDRQDEAQHRIS